MRYLPINYDTKEKNCLVLGGGILALSKIKELLNTDFKIYAISESFVEDIHRLSEENPSRLLIKEIKLADNFAFFAYDFIVIATNNFDLNSELEKKALKSKMLYERCDIVSNSSVISSLVVNNGDITVGISNQKLSPEISEIILEDIKKLISNYNQEKIEILNKIRTELVRKNSPNISSIIKNLYNEEKITLNSYLEDIIKEQEKKTEEFSTLNVEMEDSNVAKEENTENAENPTIEKEKDSSEEIQNEEVLKEDTQKEEVQSKEMNIE